jgi:hypothetical protein
LNPIETLRALLQRRVSPHGPHSAVELGGYAAQELRELALNFVRLTQKKIGNRRLYHLFTKIYRGGFDEPSETCKTCLKKGGCSNWLLKPINRFFNFVKKVVGLNTVIHPSTHRPRHNRHEGHRHRRHRRLAKGGQKVKVATATAATAASQKPAPASQQVKVATAAAAASAATDADDNGDGMLATYLATAGDFAAADAAALPARVAEAAARLRALEARTVVVVAHSDLIGALTERLGYSTAPDGEDGARELGMWLQNCEVRSLTL